MNSFSQKVYQIVKKIPAGKVATYSQIAKFTKNPKAYRAVGQALKRNPTPVTIPCHRVVTKTGRIAKNYTFGGWREQKRKLLAEGIQFRDKMYVDFTKSLFEF